MWAFQDTQIRSQRMLMEEPSFEEFKQTVTAVEQTTAENLFGTTIVLGKGKHSGV